jgi:hypothetical protein
MAKIRKDRILKELAGESNEYYANSIKEVEDR